MMILAFIFGVVTTLFPLCVMTHRKNTQPKITVHFYVARDKNGDLWLYLGKPKRRCYTFLNSYGAIGSFMASEYHFIDFGLTPDDFKDLEWEDEPVEVFLNMEE